MPVNQRPGDADIAGLLRKLARILAEDRQGVIGYREGDAAYDAVAIAEAVAELLAPEVRKPASALEALQAIVAAANSTAAQGGEMYFAEAVSGPIREAAAFLGIPETRQ